SLPPRTKKIIIWSDLSNSVDAFNTLHSSNPHAALILEAVVLFELRHHCSLRIMHIAGAQNPADPVSRRDIVKTKQLSPAVRLRNLTPPHWPPGLP
ncbi:hypothetical protein DFS34DRAFT_564510, partial [Phlyctochytrium arcticum]